MPSFQRELTLPFSRIMVAIPAASDEHGRDDNGKIAGFLCRWLIADECHVLNIAVHPESRRLGIGTVLLTEAIAEQDRWAQAWLRWKFVVQICPRGSFIASLTSKNGV